MLGPLRPILRRILPGRIYETLRVFKSHVLGGSIPSMITRAEAEFYAATAAARVGKPGVIVDLGCWMGSTSIALARGVLRAPAGRRSNERIVAYDLFVWQDWMASAQVRGVYRNGESFLPEARRLVRDHGGGLIELVRADLTQIEWPGEPIKILLVDAMKSAALSRQIVRAFFPALPGGALVVHQDFKHFYTPWIHLIHSELRDHFRRAHNVRGSGTVAFELQAPIPVAALERAIEFESRSADQVAADFDYGMSLVEPAERCNIAAAHIMHYVHLRQLDPAQALLERYRAQGFDRAGEFPLAVGRLEALARSRSSS